jgi:hypothetical protein
MMSLHSKLTGLGATGAVIAALAMVLPSGASALCIEPCHLPPPPPPPTKPPAPPPLSITGSQQIGIGVWTLSTQVGGSNQIQAFSDGDIGHSDIGETVFTASGPTGSPITVTAEDTQTCMSLLGDPLLDSTEFVTASGNGTATVSFFPNQTCPPEYLMYGSVQKAWATQGSVTTPTLTFAHSMTLNGTPPA